MAVDFDALVLAPCMDVFARPCTVTPLASQPTSPIPYAARGVWSIERNVDLDLQGGGVLSTDDLKFGIRYSEFAIPPIPGDRFEIDGVMYIADDLDDDGEGGADVTLKAVVS